MPLKKNSHQPRSPFVRWSTHDPRTGLRYFVAELVDGREQYRLDDSIVPPLDPRTLSSLRSCCGCGCSWIFVNDVKRDMAIYIDSFFIPNIVVSIIAHILIRLVNSVIVDRRSMFLLKKPFNGWWVTGSRIGDWAMDQHANIDRNNQQKPCKYYDTWFWYSYDWHRPNEDHLIIMVMPIKRAPSRIAEKLCTPSRNLQQLPGAQNSSLLIIDEEVHYSVDNNTAAAMSASTKSSWIKASSSTHQQCIVIMVLTKIGHYRQRMIGNNWYFDIYIILYSFCIMLWFWSLQQRLSIGTDKHKRKFWWKGQSRLSSTLEYLENNAAVCRIRYPMDNHVQVPIEIHLDDHVLQRW